jgi:hypothetical protein
VAVWLSKKESSGQSKNGAADSQVEVGDTSCLTGNETNVCSDKKRHFAFFPSIKRTFLAPPLVPIKGALILLASLQQRIFSVLTQNEGGSKIFLKKGGTCRFAGTRAQRPSRIA